MRLFRQRHVPAIECGDRFVKVDGGKIWEVTEIWTAVDGIVHARLTSEEIGVGRITIATNVLADPVFWHPAPDVDPAQSLSFRH